jgi:hypothetical protein
VVADVAHRTENGVVSGPAFSVEVDQNRYLPAGGRDVSAIVTVTAPDSMGGAAEGASPQELGDGGSAEIIIVDCSGSMDYPPSKLAEARAATAAAVDVVRDGTWFAIVAGTHTAWPVYPSDGSMAIAGERTRAEAKSALRLLRANGGTAIGQWLRLAHQIFQTVPATLRHAILLTDGKNQHEKPEELAVAIALCEGDFRCDCRGVGTDWEVSELRKISTALLGTVDIIVEPAGLAADFEEMMRGAMSKQLPDVLLRVRTPRQATLKFVKQVAPSIDDLTARRAPSGPQAGDFPTGAWAPGESRDYHVSIQVTPAGIAQEMLVARVSLVASSPSGQQVLGQGLVRVTWTEDEELSTRINPHVAHYTGQAELAAAIQEGIEASRQGDEELATARLGRAVALAYEAGNAETARLLARVVDVLDAPTGTVRLKKRVDVADEMALDTRSTKTVRVGAGAGGRSYSVPPHLQADPDPGTGQARSASPRDGNTDEHGVPGNHRPGEHPPAPPERFLMAQMPARVPASAEVSLVVRISADPGAAKAAGSAPLSGLTVSPGGTGVTVVVQAPSGLVPLTALQRVITVPEAGDPPPVRFEFLAREAGLHRIVITAWAGGTFLAELGLELSVDESARYADAPVRMTPVGAVRARAGEVTLQVRSDGQRYTFQLLSEPYLFEPVPAEALTAHPSAAVERTIATLRSIARGSSGYSGGNARAWMEQAGVGLWNDMVPGLIKEQFWQLRDHIGAFSIAAGDDVIPWELLYPLAAGHDEGFLVEQFPVMRRVYGQQRSRSLLIAGTRYVMPARSPVNAQAEIASVRRVLGEDGEPAETIADLEDLLRFIESGSCGSLHFACHNAFRSYAEGSAITMSGGPFVPMLLNKAVTRRVLAGQEPLIFINACSSAGAVPEYTRMMGWAQQFMAAGAGAFVGTLWAVSSTAAQIFAETFYTALAAGNSLGEASRHARAETSRDHDDPTWLAYSVYGDPAAQAITTVAE